MPDVPDDYGLVILAVLEETKKPPSWLRFTYSVIVMYVCLVSRLQVRFLVQER